MAVWSISADGFGSSALMCAAAAAFFFYFGANGREVSETGDPTAVIEFVRDPADAIVDSATEKLAEWFDGSKPTADAPAGFDPDAAIARYMANRGEEPVAPPESAAPVRGFGRKGM